MSEASPRRPGAEEDGVREVEPAQLERWMEQGECVLIDVREPMEYERESIPGASNVPLDRLSESTLPDRDGRRLVLHCNSGRRSARGARTLAGRDLGTVWNLRGGLQAWKRKGGRTKFNPQAPIDLQRQVQIVAGSGVLLGVLGGFWSPWFLLLSAFIGAGLLYAGLSGTCGMALLLSRMPWNRPVPDDGGN